MGIARGVAITALFAVVVLVLIPAYVPRPNFIPGFAPPPDMWPRTVATLGAIFGLLLLGFSLSRKTEAIADPDPEGASEIRQGAPLGTLLLRFACVLVAFTLFVLAVGLVGFLIASILLLAAMLVLTGYWRRAWISLGVAVVLPLLLYLFFSSALNTRFPAGSLLRSLGL
ncbi:MULTISPECIES: tripartite tricarboxylate transporter TctB family protein [unclassified Vreelandella]